MGLTKVVPFLVEDELINLGAAFFQGQELGRSHGDRRPVDHRPNPASSGRAEMVLIERIGTCQFLVVGQWAQAAAGASSDAAMHRESSNHRSASIRGFTQTRASRASSRTTSEDSQVACRGRPSPFYSKEHR